MFVGVFSRIRILLGFALLYFCFSFGCGNTFNATEVIQCSGKFAAAFPNDIITLPPNEPTKPPENYKLFQTGQQFGCFGVVWKGQTNAPPAFRMKVTKGSYQLQDPGTQEFTDGELKAPIAPGISNATALLFVYKNPDPNTLDCVNIVKGGLSPCWSNPNCLFAWKVDIDTSAKTGNCRICQRELCNGADDNCDAAGDSDEKSGDRAPCGQILGTGCKFVPDLASAGPCNNSQSCQCRLVGQQRQIYICAGSNSATQSWVPLKSVTDLCKRTADSGKKHSCGNRSLLCDQCPGSFVFRRADKFNCSDVNKLVFLAQ